MTAAQIYVLIAPCIKRWLTLTILPDRSVLIDEKRFIVFDDALKFVYSIVED
jgi:hypothetical protein